jgi:HSP20 family molecular chaperone IbpA
MRRSGLKAAQCKESAAPHPPFRFTRKDSIMYFAPVVRTRARSFDRNFERFVNDAFFGGRSQGLDIQQDDKAWTITLDVPGITREELVIEIEGAVVRIETKADAKRSFKAAYELPQDIDAEASEAKLENGVLTLTLAKKQPVSTARQIAVK